MKKVLIADDHTLLREGLKQIIDERGDYLVVSQAANGAEVLDFIAREDYDVVVLDITMPGINGLDALKQIKGIKPNLPVLILSMHSEELYATRALQAGASGYLTKDSSADRLFDALDRVCSGRRYITANLAERLASVLQAEQDLLPHEKLSDREFQVLSYIAGGMTLSQIANELSISPKTVSTYRSRVLEKMSLNSNAQIIQYSIRNELI